MKNLIFSSFFILLFSLKLSAGTFKIDSQSEIVTTDSTVLMQNAARQMQKYLQQILNEPISISSEQNSSKLSIILSVNNSKFTTLSEDSFIVKSEGENIIINGADYRALFYGVYHFLQRYLDCKFLTKDFEIVPKKEYILLNEINDIQTPHFIYREFFSNESDNEEFAAKCRLNGRLGHRNAKENRDHNFPKGIAIYNEFVSSMLIKDSKFECNGQYDFSENEVAVIALNSVNKKLSNMSVEKDDYILLEHEDRDSHCTNGLKAGEVPTKPFLKYSSYIAENLKSEFSNTKVLFQAYQWSRTPPKTIKKLPENLTIFFSPIEADFSKPITSFENKKILTDLQGWNKYGNDIFIWHYITNFGGYFQPFPNIYALDEDIKLFASQENVKGLFLQSSYGTSGGELNDLRTWVFSKLLWNPNTNINTLIKEFCDAYYGNASKDVQKYIRVLHKIHKKMDGRLLVKSSIKAKYLHPEFLVYLENILEEGLKKVKDNSLHKAHLLKLFSGIDYVRIMRGDNDKNLQKSKNRFKQFLANTNGINYFAEGSKIENIKKIMEFDRKTSIPPKEAEGLKEDVSWFDFQEYTLKLHNADLVSDKSSSDGVSARMGGELDDWGFQLDVLNFPKGKWNIYANVKIEFNKDADLTDSGNIALYYGIHPTFIKGVKFFGQFEDKVYQSVMIGTINTAASNAKTIWLSPPKNSKVKAVYVDRIFVVRDK